MINTQYINLNMTPSGVMPVLYCSQYDIGRPLGMVVYNGSESVDLDTYTCTIEATRTDGTAITAAVTTSDNIGVFATTATMTNQADKYPAKLVLFDSNSRRVASLAFVMVVAAKTMDENAESIQEDESLYQQFTGAVQTIIAEIRSDLETTASTLQRNINAEVSARSSAVMAEATARQSADITLQNNISAESAARQAADQTLQNNISAEASTRATADALLQSQIDQMIAPSGEAPSTAEVQNARIGADGVTYSALGDAIRENDISVRSQVRNVDGVIFFVWEQGGINFSNSAENGNANYIRTKYANAPASSKITISNVNAMQITVHEFTSAKVRIRTSPANVTENKIIYYTSANCGYIRLNCNGTSLAVSQGQGISAISKGLDDMIYSDAIANATGLRKIDFANGYINTSGTTVDITSIQVGSTTYKYAVDACSPGDIYFLKGTGAVAARLYAFIKSNGELVWNTGINDTTNGGYYKLMAPANSAYAVFDVVAASAYNLFKMVDGADHITPIDCKGYEFTYGRFLPQDTAYHFTRTAIITSDYVPDCFNYLKVVGNGIKVAVVAFSQSGKVYAIESWYRDGDAFRFNHDFYKYKIYALYEDEAYIFDFDDVASKIVLIADTDGLASRISAYKDSTNSMQNYVKAVGQSLRTVMANNYTLEYANAPMPIALKSYVGDNQNVHPKVLYIPDGFGGHVYWMAYTPYPLAIDTYENPCIAYSDDGYTWENIGGNPLDDPNTSGIYDSDTHLVYRSDTGTLECWYRRVDTTVTPNKEIIYRQTTTDGYTWSAKEQLYVNDSGDYDKLLSPAVIWDGTKYCVWVVYRAASIYYYTVDGTDAAQWTYVRRIAPTWEDRGATYIPWHIDVINDNGTYVMVMMCKSSDLSIWTTFCTTSTDNINYLTPWVIIRGASAGWDRYQYRPSITKVGSVYRLYYSAGSEAYGRSSVWGIGVSESTDLTHFIGKLPM